MKETRTILQIKQEIQNTNRKITTEFERDGWRTLFNQRKAENAGKSPDYCLLRHDTLISRHIPVHWGHGNVASGWRAWRPPTLCIPSLQFHSPSTPSDLSQAAQSARRHCQDSCEQNRQMSGRVHTNVRWSVWVRTEAEKEWDRSTALACVASV
jgi:hypothetical protein